ncbi:hypothetical protein [Streptomyces sp. NPDC048590]
MVHVPRSEALIDLLESLPADDRDRLLRSEVKLISYLDSRRTGAAR